MHARHELTIWIVSKSSLSKVHDSNRCFLERFGTKSAINIVFVHFHRFIKCNDPFRASMLITMISPTVQVAVDSVNSRVFVTSAVNDTLWIFNILEVTNDDGCALLELQVYY